MTHATSEVDWLAAWYTFWCDGDWEHTYGLTISTLSQGNGWALEADLTDTQFEDCPWEGLAKERSPEDWINVVVDATKFKAEGGLWNLLEMVQGFRSWSQGVEPVASELESPTRFLASLPFEP